MSPFQLTLFSDVDRIMDPFSRFYPPNAEYLRGGDGWLNVDGFSLAIGLKIENFTISTRI